MTTLEYNFRFIPQLPTKEAFENRPFNEIRGREWFMQRLLDYEKANPSKKMEGLIRFRPGVASKYYDGTEAHTYDDRKWWELGYTSCSGQCCFAPPYEPLIKWKPVPDDATEEEKAANKAELAAIFKEVDRIAEANYAKHVANPRPMPKFRRKTIAPKREWQEFRRIKGPGGLNDQLKQIDNFQDVVSISFTGLGWFYAEAC